MEINLNDISKLPSIDLLAKQLVEGFITGLHKSPYHGFSVEFAEHRLYNYGESTRHIDWKVYSRTDKLFSKRYEEETNLRAYVLLDCSSSMYYPVHNYGKIRYSAIAAAALAYLLQRQRDAVGLITMDTEIRWFSEVKSTEVHLQRILTQLEALLQSQAQRSGTAVAANLHLIAEKIHQRSLVMLFTDMFDNEDDEAVFRALQHLKHRKNEVLVFHVVDEKTERKFEFEDRPYEFEDMESGEKFRVNPFEIREQFEQMSTEKYQQLKLRCRQMKIDFIEVDINENVDKILGNFLIKRTKMR
jgi:uncharacterized protein (DUF58 family)